MSNEKKDLAKWELIQALDLSKVKEKLKSKKGFWWKWKNDVNKIELQYKQFLYTAAINPEEIVVPFSQDMDDLWHEHILDTSKYEKDCMAIFGKIFHHNPHLPVGSKEQVKAYTKTKEMYKEAFAEKAKSKSSDNPGCSGSTFIPIFCGGGVSQSHAAVSHHDSGSHSHDSGGHSSDSGGHSGCGGSSASCGGGGGGGGCGGGGGGCGGGGD